MPDRIAEKIDASGDCWEWIASKYPAGYGQVWWKGKPQPAHRAVLEALVADIPDGMQVDHLCRNRSCVNPDHLEVVTQVENLRRGASGTGKAKKIRTHCKHGHEFAPENTLVDSRQRYCATCRRKTNRESKQRQRERLKSE